MSLSTTLSLPVEAAALPRPFRILSLKKRPAGAAPALPVQRLSSRSLLGDARELVIEHQGSEYHLRLTRNDKLILTK
ncbi:hemin uptake protein HemP [Fulvimonas sp. R45]|uniref:hemin uptake protein HemP n=1 Tax=Fulvimonas sp. R45 TaxID=3045937 RepID=UPI00265F373B|nr:hemin uptake protein HemP [Fulvimonas sp. R45]MDO1528232.1 hemin uptake protein HemP [Fulvimonas sp. R45]